MKTPRRAIVLAAGFGSRLSPLTLDCPKALVPLRGKAIIAQVLDQLGEWGVREVLVNVHHLAEKLVAELPVLCPRGMKLNMSFEPEILGTGGGLRRMAWFLDEQPIWVCNADVRQRLDPRPLLRAWERERPLACLWMIPDRGPRTVKVERGRVTDFRPGGVTFSGLHLLDRRVLPYLPERAFSSVIEAYDAALAAGETILGVEVPDSEWADIGTPDQLLEAQGGSVIFPGAEVEKGVKLERALVGPGARLEKGHRASGLIVSPLRGLTDDERKGLPEVQAVGLLPVRGSDRNFRRLYFPAHSEILISSGEARPENLRFAGHTRFLARNRIRVPAVRQSRRQGRWLRMEDLGTTHLLDRLQSGSEIRNRRDLREVLALVARLHALKPPPGLRMEPAFDSKLYAWERDLFEKEFFSRHAKASGLRKPPAELFRVSEILAAQPRVLIHRDLQSTNLMRVKGEWALIDYQGMRLGAAAYDLGSLLADPYVDRPKDLQLTLLADYNRLAARPVSEAVFAAGCVQRLLQALGAYGRLGALKGGERFLEHIPAALRQLELWGGEFLEGQGGGNALWGTLDE